MISVIIPNYNNARLLEKMIGCILEQKYKNWELIIVDDGSTDNSVNIISNYAKTDKRIICISRDRDPKGGQTCRNIGFEKSSGKYVVFFDSDDLVSSDCLEQRVNFMEKHPEIDFGVFPAHTFLNEKSYDKVESSTVIYGLKKKSDVFSDLLMAKYQFTVWTNIYKKESILNIKWDEDVLVLQDFDFNVSCILANLEFKFCENAAFDYFYRKTPTSTSVTHSFTSELKCNSTIYLHSKTLAALRQRSDFKKRKKEFLKFVILHFERLVIDGNNLMISNYIKYCLINYGHYTAFSMNFISVFTNLFRARSLKKGILYILILIMLHDMSYIKKIADGVKTS